MKAISKTIKKYWAMIWMITAALLTTGAFITIAAYTGVHSVKRVVTTTASPHDLFSSNCLISKNNPEPKRLTSTQYTVTVCNYEQNQPSFANPEDIPYTLTAYLMVNTDNGFVRMSTLDISSDIYSAAIAKLNVRTYSIQQTQNNSETDFDNALKIFDPSNLSYSYPAKDGENSGLILASNPQGTLSSTDKFLITLDSAEVALNKTEPDFAIEVVAESGALFGTINRTLYASSAVAEPVTWTGNLLESNCATVNYDFYNYVLSGSGIGTIDIMWDPTKFEINPFFFSTTAGYSFIEKNDSIIYPCDMHSGWNQGTLSVDSTVKNRYELQLYKCVPNTSYTDDTNAEPPVLNAASRFIDCKFHEGTSASQANSAATP